MSSLGARDVRSDVNVTLQTLNQPPYLFNNVPLPYMPGTYAQNSNQSLVNPQARDAHTTTARATTRPSIPSDFSQGTLLGTHNYPNTPNYLSFYPNMAAPSSATGSRTLGLNPMHSVDNEKEVVNICIPSTMVGAIIGKSGSVIKEMVVTSGASIRVAAPAPGHLGNNSQKIWDHNHHYQNHNPSHSTSGDQDEPAPSPETTQQIGTEQEETQQATLDSESESQGRNNSNVTNAQIGGRQNNFNDSIRRVTIVGNPESQWTAQYFIYRKVALETKKNDVSLMVEIQVPSHLVGRIIGKGGNTVKQIQKQTRASIRLPDEKPDLANLNSESETLVQITGEFQCSQMAQRNIRALIKDNSYSSSRSQTKQSSRKQTDVNVTLQTFNQQPYLFNNVPVPYMTGPYAQNSILSSLVNPQARHAITGRHIPLNPSQGPVPGPPIYPNSVNYLSLYPNMAAPPSAAGSRMLGFNPMHFVDNEKEVVNICIPSTMVGAIIGKSGSVIKEMVVTSGASIRVAVATPSQLGNSSQKIWNENHNPSHSTSGNQDEPAPSPETTQQISSEQEQPEQIIVDNDSTEPGKNSPTVTSFQSATRQNNFNDSVRRVTIVGNPESQWTAQYFIYRKVALETKKNDVSLMVEIQVPSHLVGRIIGKGGNTVKQIQKQTRASIRLPDEKPDLADIDSESMTLVQIKGEFQCSQMAQRHIRALIKDNSYSSSRSQTKQSSIKQVDSNTDKYNAQQNFNEEQHIYNESLLTSGQEVEGEQEVVEGRLEEQLGRHQPIEGREDLGEEKRSNAEREYDGIC